MGRNVIRALSGMSCDVPFAKYHIDAQTSGKVSHKNKNMTMFVDGLPSANLFKIKIASCLKVQEN